jgi:hypothetical protein
MRRLSDAPRPTVTLKNSGSLLETRLGCSLLGG